MTIIQFFILATLFLFSPGSYASGKAMDCRECRENYGSNEPCEPICGGAKVTGSKAAKLFKQMKELGAHQCTEGSCDTEFPTTTCSWQTGNKAEHYECSYTNVDGKTAKLQGTAAQKLARALQMMGKAKSVCEGNKCQFVEPLTAQCSEMKSGKKKVAIYECRVMVVLDGMAAKSQDAKPETAAPTKDKSKEKGIN